MGHMDGKHSRSLCHVLQELRHYNQYPGLVQERIIYSSIISPATVIHSFYVRTPLVLIHPIGFGRESVEEFHHLVVRAFDQADEERMDQLMQL
jgi:hypothetical protein